jgi:glycosyltransferase involved in cell wall biosynthesis
MPSDNVRPPKVSIGLPVYNGASFLRQAVDSILQQDYTDFELIISDNASTDDTSTICLSYAAIDPRVRYFRNESNIGAGPNYRRVFDLARGDLFKWAAHDDVHLSGFLRRCVETMDRAPLSVSLVSPKSEVIDENGQTIRNDWQPETLDTREDRPHLRVAHVLTNIAWATAQFGLYRTAQLGQTRLIDSFFASDHVLLMEIAILGEIWEIPEVLFQRRYHSGISNLVNKSQADFLEWFDPSRTAKVRWLPRVNLDLVPRWRLLWEFERSVRRLPLRTSDRFFCGMTALRIWTVRESRRLYQIYLGIIQRRLSMFVAADRE